MRCPNCAGEIPAGSRFCGICGRNITVAPLAEALGDAARGGRWPAAAARPEPAQPAMSLFELPVSRRARTAKLALVLVLDAILAGAGVVMILSYLDARRAAPQPARKAPAAAGAVKVGAPKAVAPEVAPTRAQPAKTEKKQETGNRQPATGNRQPKAAPLAATPPRPSEPASGAPEPVAEAGEGAAGEEADDGRVDDLTGRLTAAVARRAGDLERCYQRAAKVSGPQGPLEGRIDVHVTVMPDGSAQGVRAGENTTGSAQLADCAVSLFRTVTVEAGAAEPVEIVWPLQFRPPDK